MLAAPWVTKGMGYNARHNGLYFELGSQIDVPCRLIFTSVDNAKNNHSDMVGVGNWSIIECDVIKIGDTHDTLIPRKVVDTFNSLPNAPRGRR